MNLAASDCVPPEVMARARNADVEALIEWTLSTPVYKANSDAFDFLIAGFRGPHREKAARACREISHNFFNHEGFEELQVLWMAHAGFLASGRPYAGMKGPEGSWLKFARFFMLLLVTTVFLFVAGGMAIFGSSQSFDYYRLLAGNSTEVTGTVTAVETPTPDCRIVSYEKPAGTRHKLTLCGRYTDYALGKQLALLVSSDGEEAVMDDSAVALELLLGSLLVGYAIFGLVRSILR